MKRTLLALLGLVAASGAAAETVNCTTITSLPTVIASQGVYCLKQDLSTAISSGAAIEIATNNVTLDCYGYKVGGLAGGASSTASGISAMQRNNITVRNCNVRGFLVGIDLNHNATPNPMRPTGHIVENNRIDSSTALGIVVSGDASTVRHNIISDIGGNTSGFGSIGIRTFFNVDVIDNTIESVFQSDGVTTNTYGIISWNSQGGVIADNRIRNLLSATTSYGIVTTFDSSGNTIRGNVITAANGGLGVECISGAGVAVDNTIFGFGFGISSCTDGGGNVIVGEGNP